MKTYKKVGYEKLRCFSCGEIVEIENYISPEDNKCFSYGKIIKGCSCGKFNAD